MAIKKNREIELFSSISNVCVKYYDDLYFSEKCFNFHSVECIGLFSGNIKVSLLPVAPFDTHEMFDGSHNRVSMLILLQYGGQNVLFTGDAEGDSLDRMLRNDGGYLSVTDNYLFCSMILYDSYKHSESRICSDLFEEKMLENFFQNVWGFILQTIDAGFSSLNQNPTIDNVDEFCNYMKYIDSLDNTSKKLLLTIQQRQTLDLILGSFPVPNNTGKRRKIADKSSKLLLIDCLKTNYPQLKLSNSNIVNQPQEAGKLCFFNTNWYIKPLSLVDICLILSNSGSVNATHLARHKSDIQQNIQNLRQILSNIDVVFLPHHGTETKNSQRFLAFFSSINKKTIYVVSSSPCGTNRLPKKSTIEMLPDSLDASHSFFYEPDYNYYYNGTPESWMGCMINKPIYETSAMYDFILPVSFNNTGCKVTSCNFIPIQ